MDQRIQDIFFNQLKGKLPPATSLAHILEDTLSISSDSAYRRIRGETSLTFDEIEKISLKFDISVDSLIQREGNSVTFNYAPLDSKTFSFSSYLKGIDSNLDQIEVFKEKQIIYAAKDIPLFHLYHFPVHHGLIKFGSNIKVLLSTTLS